MVFIYTFFYHELTSSEPYCCCIFFITQTISTVPDRKRLADTVSNNSEKASQDDSSVPNRLSEELLRCLLAIFSQMGGSSASGQDEEQAALSPSVSGSCESSEDAYPQDPYGILEFGTRDVGSYKRFHVIDATSFDQTAMENDTMLTRKLKCVLASAIFRSVITSSVWLSVE